MRKIKCGLAVMLLVILALMTPLSAAAYAPYQGYQYNSKQEVVPAPASFVPYFDYTGVDAGKLNAPQDVYVDQNNQEIYIADTGNNRILVLNKDYTFEREYREFKTAGGVETMSAPSGIYVSSNGTMYIADRDNGRILVADQDGNLEQNIPKPESEFIDQTMQYIPEKVVADSMGRIYVQARGMYQGILCMDAQGNFLQFFGSNQVELTASVLLQQFWKSIMTKEQRETFADFVPIEYSNLYIDEEDFIYSVVKTSENQEEQIKKLNAQGTNILRTNENALLATSHYGDPTVLVESGSEKKSKTSTAFIDVCVDSNDFIFALDQTKGRIFVYDQDSNPITIFGGLGEQMGLFSSPTAVDTLNGQVMVLDAKKNCLTVFHSTEFGDWIEKALLLYNDGLYLKSQEPWNEVLKRDMNNELAYIGIGKALYGMNEYEDAMEYFYLGYDRDGYSKSFKEYRNNVVRENFTLIFFGIVAVIAVIIVLRRVLEPVGAKLHRSTTAQTILLPFRTMLHPFDSYDEIKWNNQGSVPVALGILAAWFIISIMNRQLTGFIFTPVGGEDFNSIFIFAGTVILFFIAVIANWCISTLVECEGSFKKIFIGASYALMPVLVLDLVNIVLSHFLVLEEGVLLTAIKGLSIVWAIILLEISFITIHQISFKKAVSLTLGTILGVGAILFILMLLFSLYQQVSSFVINLYNEIRFRI